MQQNTGRCLTKRDKFGKQCTIQKNNLRSEQMQEFLTALSKLKGWDEMN